MQKSCTTSPFPQFPCPCRKANTSLGPKLRFRSTLILDNVGAALPSLNSVQANSQRPHPTHFIGSAITIPWAFSIIIRGFVAPLAKTGPSTDIPMIETPLTFKNYRREQRGFRLNEPNARSKTSAFSLGLSISDTSFHKRTHGRASLAPLSITSKCISLNSF